MVGYFRYLDDILIVFDNTTINITELHKEFNNPDHSLNFRPERQGKRTNFMDIITIQTGDRQFSVFRTLTATDTIIHNSSCRPPKHKQGAISQLPQEQNTTLPIIHRRKKKRDNIQTILYNNGYCYNTSNMEKNNNK
jgi:hypothetical protein